MFWKHPVEPRMLPPIHDANDLSKLLGLENTFILLVYGSELAYLRSDMVETLFVAFNKAWQQRIAACYDDAAHQTLADVDVCFV